MNAISYKEIFPLIKDNKIWLGTTAPKEFIEPNGGTKKFGNINWFTNLDHGLRHEKMILDTMANNLRFNKSLRKRLDKYGIQNEYPKYDNYNAIEVPLVKCIPSDYNGKMGVPISFLNKYNPDQFEIIGGFNGSKLEEKAKFNYVPSRDTPAIISGKEKLWNGPTINKKTLYYRIIILNKHPK